MSKLMNDAAQSVKRIEGLEKIALLGSIGQSMYLGNKIDSLRNGDSDLYGAAYEVANEYGSTETAIKFHAKKEQVGKGVAMLAVALGLAKKIPLLKALPIALATYGYGAVHGGEKEKFKALSGRAHLMRSDKHI